MAKDKNPANKPKKDPERVELELESDGFNKTEQKRIVTMVMEDAEADIQVQAKWVEDKKLAIDHYEGEQPSRIEGLDKKEWQSDRNLNICAAVCDIYQAAILSTVYNPSTMYFKPTEENDFHNKDNSEKFMKWVVTPAEANAQPEIDDYIHNKITTGFCAFKVYWKVWFDWVDKRLWNDKTKSYDIKTEYMRFERGVIENIANMDDILIPRYGKNVQELPHIIHVLHQYPDNIEEKGEPSKWITLNALRVLKRYY